jgi:hypothetical protein
MSAVSSAQRDAPLRILKDGYVAASNGDLHWHQHSRVGQRHAVGAECVGRGSLTRPSDPDVGANGDRSCADDECHRADRIGQKLIIPTGNSPTPLAVTPSPTPIKPRPVSTQSIALGDAFVTIREIVSNGRLSEEAVVLTNLGSKVNLKGWTLADGESHKYPFPDLTLLPNSEVNVHTKSGVNTATDLYWGQPEARWGATGAVAYLRDPNGKLIATYRVP